MEADVSMTQCNFKRILLRCFLIIATESTYPCSQLAPVSPTLTIFPTHFIDTILQCFVVFSGVSEVHVQRGRDRCGIFYETAIKVNHAEKPTQVFHRLRFQKVIYRCHFRGRELKCYVLDILLHLSRTCTLPDSLRFDIVSFFRKE